MASFVERKPKRLNIFSSSANSAFNARKHLQIGLGLNWNIENMKDILRKRRLPKAKSRLITAIFCNLVYAIWKVRNDAIWQKKVMTVGRVVDTIKTDSKIRFTSLFPNRVTALWLRNLWLSLFAWWLNLLFCLFLLPKLFKQILVTLCVAFLRYLGFFRAHEE